MGFFDSILSSVRGSSSDQGSLEKLATTIITHHQSGNGLAGLLQEFEQHGLGPIARSWVSTGANLPISREQIQEVLGSEMVQQLAAKVGIGPEQLSSLVAQFLPKVVDQLTPNGQVPQGAELEKEVSNLIHPPGSQG